MNTQKCHDHPDKLLAPTGMAVLLERGRENETADRLNVERFIGYEKDLMRTGIMRFRHFTYEAYCQYMPFSYK